VSHKHIYSANNRNGSVDYDNCLRVTGRSNTPGCVLCAPCLIPLKGRGVNWLHFVIQV